MMLKLIVFILTFIQIAQSATISETIHPNVIIMHVNNLEWNDLGIHVNKANNENSTPNIDRLAYSGILLNRFYANGGIKSLYSGCNQRSSYANQNLMKTYFERNGYSYDSISIKNYTKVGAFYRQIIASTSHANEPFLMSIDFGNVNTDIKLPLIDEIVGNAVKKLYSEDLLDNTIIIFLSLPIENNDNDEIESSSIESNIRRTTFIYSRLLALPQSVSYQLVHISDILPTLVNATNLHWKTRDRIYIDGVSQWMAINTNDDIRASIYGDNFYINKNWKLSYGTSQDVFYDSISNQRMEISDGKHEHYDLNAYVRSITSSDIHVYLDDLTANRIILMRNRAKVHCNLNDMDESSFVINFKCSQIAPCLFDLQSDPCEFDDKHEHEFDMRRDHMKDIFEQYLKSGIIQDLNVEFDSHHNVSNADETETSTEHDSDIADPILTPSGGIQAFLTLMITLFVFIFTLVLIACIKERCNSRRSVYIDKTKKNKVTFKDESGHNGISTISSQVQQSSRL